MPFPAIVVRVQFTLQTPTKACDKASVTLAEDTAIHTAGRDARLATIGKWDREVRCNLREQIKDLKNGLKRTEKVQGTDEAPAHFIHDHLAAHKRARTGFYPVDKKKLGHFASAPSLLSIAFCAARDQFGP